MKNLYSILFAWASLGFVACSSMKVDDAEATESALPSDFNVAIYAEINPDIPIAQLKDQILLENAKTKDSIGLSDITVDQRKDLRARIAADDSMFLADTSLLHYVLVTYSGFKESDWSDSILLSSVHKDKLNACKVFNTLKKTPAEDRLILQSFVPDMDLVAKQYILYGDVEGRAYKYCTAGSFGALKDSVQATDTTVLGYKDYRPMTFCMNKDDGKVYLNQ